MALLVPSAALRRRLPQSLCNGGNLEVTLLKQIAGVFDVQAAWLATSIFALYTYKKSKEYLEARKQRRTETLQSLKDFIESESNEQSTLVRELLFEDHFGKPLSNHEISYFVNTKQPSKYLKMYLSARNYLEVSKDGKKVDVRNKKNLGKGKWWNLGLYCIFGVAGLFMLLGAKTVFFEIGPGIYAPWTLVTLCLIAMAGIGLDASSSADTARTLLDELAEDDEPAPETLEADSA